MRATDVRMSSILRQISVLNCILLVCVLAFAYFILAPIFTVDVKVPSASSAAVEAVGPEKEQAAEPVVNPPMQDYAVIPEKNLFHPDRIIPVEKKEVTIPRPEFVLYGTLIVDDVRIAYLSDKKAPRTTPGRGERQVGLKVGETLSGYTLKEVLPDAAVLARDDDRIELKIISPENKKNRGAAESGAPAIPGGMAAQPAKPSPQGQQALPQLQTLPIVPTTGQGPAVQMPTPIPGARTRRPIGRW
jgi:hypothetical protein